MGNESITLVGLALALSKTANMIEHLAGSLGMNNETSELYETMLLDELNHAQVLTIELTRLMAGSTDEGEAEPEAEAGEES